MRRVAAAVARAAAVVVAVALTAACAPDVMPVREPSGLRIDDGPPSTPPSSPAGVCGSVDAGNFDILLSPQDIRPKASTWGQGEASYLLEPDACQSRLAATPFPASPLCQLEFPYFTEDVMVTEFARMGITSVEIGQDYNMRSDDTILSTVREVIAALGAEGGSGLADLAQLCGAQQDGNRYTATTHGAINMVLQVDPDQVIALVFDEKANLTNAQKLALLDKAIVQAQT
jgi:hypothetical protein